MTLVNEILQKAIAGESTAAKKYQKFAEIAKAEGFKNIAYLFKALVAAENIHIKNHRTALGEKFDAKIEDFTTGKTMDNVNAGIQGETWEFDTMYPDLLKQLTKGEASEAMEVAELSLKWARLVEQTHAEVLNLAMKALSEGKDLDIQEIYVCKVCGNLVLAKPEDICKICDHDPAFYFLVKRE